MKYKFRVYGRPKNVDIDELLARVNKTFQEMWGDEDTKVMFHHLLGVVSFTGPETFSEVDLQKIKEMIKTTFEKRFSDVAVNQIKK